MFAEGGVGKPAVALVRGNDRYANIRRALELITDQIDLTGVQRVLVKPNMVSCSYQLAATHVDAVRATLAFVRERYSGRILVAEGTGLPAHEGFQCFGFQPMEEEFGIELSDLNSGDWSSASVYDGHLRPLEVRLAREVVDSDFRISVSPPKTHDSMIVTLSLKNMVMGSLFHEVPAGGKGLARGWLREFYHRVPSWMKYNAIMNAVKQTYVRRASRSDRVAMHDALDTHHLNMFLLAPRVYPHLAVLDGFLAMEGDGPGGGDPVDWRLALASTDFLAADALCTHLMGFDLHDVGYLYYCHRAGLGVADIDRMDILGEDPASCRRPFKPSPIIGQQLKWRQMARRLRPMAASFGLQPEWMTGD
jgi:uncharacterized protein (DUF362 family)